MPIFTSLSKHDLAAYRKTSRQPRLELLQPYLSFLQDKSLGEGGIVQLEADEQPRTVKRRLTVAAKQQGKKLKYRTGPEGQLVFEIVPERPKRPRKKG